MLLQLNKWGKELVANNKVSIPQAVSAVATDTYSVDVVAKGIASFNTASGKCCCNEWRELYNVFF